MGDDDHELLKKVWDKFVKFFILQARVVVCDSACMECTTGSHACAKNASAFTF